MIAAGVRGLFLCVALAGCASSASLDAAVDWPQRAPALRFGVDTFAFANESRSKNWDKPDLFANYCFVMTRAAVQFQRFARFDPELPRIASEEYTDRVSRVLARAPWRAPLPRDERVVIPGYASLFDLSRAEEQAVKRAFPSQFWTFAHWTNWRVVVPVPAAHQDSVAREAVAEIRAGRPMQLLVTNFPTFELNHGVVAYDYRVAAQGALEFLVYDPNDPSTPGLITFDAEARRFEATRLFDTEPGPMRAFRLHYSPFL